MVERYQFTDAFSFLPLRHALLVRFDTPTAWAAWVKFMPSLSNRRTYSARRAAHISFLVG